MHRSSPLSQGVDVAAKVCGVSCEAPASPYEIICPLDTIASSEKICPLDAVEEKRQNTDKFMLRLPDGMRDRIKVSADANGRSMNAEIVQLLDREYPVETYSAEDFLDLLRQVTDAPNSDSLDGKEDLLNSALKHLNFDFSATVVNGSITFVKD